MSNKGTVYLTIEKPMTFFSKHKKKYWIFQRLSLVNNFLNFLFLKLRYLEYETAKLQFVLVNE